MKEISNDLFLRAARREKVERLPAWYMRQAGRSQPEYRALKEKYSLFEITHQPELCSYVTRLPVENYGVDAAVLYKDIMSPLPGMGVDVEIKTGIGPVIAHPIRRYQDVENLAAFDAKSQVPYILETIKLLREEQLDVPLIGFGGAPFTLASYLVEGGPSKNYYQTKALMYQDEATWFALMDKLATMTADYLSAQIEAGASAVQLFDSWVGALSREDYHYYIKPSIRMITTKVKAKHPQTPIIMQAVAAGHLLPEWNDVPIDVVGIDWRMSIAAARDILPEKALQGNLDPALLLAPQKSFDKAKTIIGEAVKQPGFIFNLGHGVFPEVSPSTLKQLTALVHSESEKLLKER